jgi:hypothetical protein
MRRVNIENPSFQFDDEDPVLPDRPGRRAFRARRDGRDRTRPAVLDGQGARLPRDPDSDKIGIWAGNKADDLMVLRPSGVGYFVGEGD